MGLDGNGQPYYTLTQGHEPIIGKSTSGMRFKDGSLNRDFRILKTATASKDETWNEPWGEETSVCNHYNELTVALRQQSGQHWLLTLVFRVFDDGIGFRYVFPE
ncbi:hypothetical protein PRBRB14_03880 [Hallella multisaccharivorax DSM 17128]|uniref:glycoside hydrolase family 97 N-terminal domain-containing protein n=1 Tax=Hallella multisaccharivorax TaxID=310514 RepID=UPI00031E9F3E|nr:glycoside hydrolase family 97 N-terminal domain-containing protein [Hallella multisaccharivorax]GJG29509.1 hypothetical protein PRBRB14_03880 [Hallella multisaccharivorax DSM 17128]